MKLVTTIIARILFSFPLIAFGIGHLMNGGALSGIVPSWLPGGAFWVYVTGTLFILGGLGILFNKWTRQSAFVIAGMLTVFVLTIHIPGAMNNGLQAVMGNLFKDIIIIGGALFFADMPRNTMNS